MTNPLKYQAICTAISIAIFILVLTALTSITNGQTAESNITLENVMFDSNAPRMIVLTIRNLGDIPAKIDRIYINNNSFSVNASIQSRAVQEAAQEYDWVEGSEYSIRAATANGDQVSTVQDAPTDDSKLANANALNIADDQRTPGLAILLIVSLLVFLLLIFIGAVQPPNTDKNSLGSSDANKNSWWSFDLQHGQIRSAIAGTLVFGFIILTLFTLYYPINESDIYIQYSQFVAIVIGFYFGSRSTATAGIAGAQLATQATAEGAKAMMKDEEEPKAKDTSAERKKAAVKTAEEKPKIEDVDAKDEKAALDI